MYQYVAKLHRVVDGDTLDLNVDLGFTVSVLVRFRLASINAPEMIGSSHDAGKAAKAGLEALLALASKGMIYVESTGKDKYGRWVAKLTFVSTAGGAVVDVSQALVTEGFAVLHAY